MQARTPDGFEAPTGAAGNGKTAQSYIAGIGASGALLAGAVVTFVFLVGTVSFEVWPDASDSGGGTRSLGIAELSGGGDGSASAIARHDRCADRRLRPLTGRPGPGPRRRHPRRRRRARRHGREHGRGLRGHRRGLRRRRHRRWRRRDGRRRARLGNGGGGGGANDPSDRPSHSDPRPTDGPGSGTGTAATPPSTGGSDSDRPTAGDRGRG